MPRSRADRVLYCSEQKAYWLGRRGACTTNGKGYLVGGYLHACVFSLSAESSVTIDVKLQVSSAVSSGVACGVLALLLVVDSKVACTAPPAAATIPPCERVCVCVSLAPLLVHLFANACCLQVPATLCRHTWPVSLA